MELTDAQIEKMVKGWITKYGSEQDYIDFNKIVDRIEKNQGIKKFPYANAAEIFEKSQDPYSDLKTLIKIKGEDVVLQELKTLVTIYNNQFNKVLDQLDVIEGRIDDIYQFAEELDDKVYEKFMDMMNTPEDVCEDSCKEKSYCVCNEGGTPKVSEDKKEIEVPINYDFDFSALGALIKDLVKKQMANNSNKNIQSI